MSETFLTRFAPSPTGYLHKGHAFAAQWAFGLARERGGVCLLRLEDIDQTRCSAEFGDAIFEDLAWLGFRWPEPVRRQSEHFDDYTAALDRLSSAGLVYRSFLTRSQLAAELDDLDIRPSPAGERPYPGPRKWLSQSEEAARLEAGEAFAWRLSLSRCRDSLGEDWAELGFMETGNAHGQSRGWRQAHPEWLGDVVLARKDTPTSYHMAVCHDDALQEITDVVRGADLFHATHIHVVLQALFGWKTPRYFHHGLILDEQGRKFSKTNRSATLKSLREDGMTPEQIFEELQA